MTRAAPQTSNIVAKIWSLCHVLRGDGVSYHQYISELTYLLFLKIAKENQSEELLPIGYRWNDLHLYEGENLVGHYQEMLTHLGTSAGSKTVKEIYAFPTTVFSHSENLRVVIDGIEKLNWHDIKQDGIGLVYEGLLSKNSEDTRSGAGQYFTPRALVECIVVTSKPRLGELIQDPASGTGGFLIAADHYVRTNSDPNAHADNQPKYEGMEIERGTYRLSLMNTFLHSMNAEIFLGDALTKDANALSRPNLVLANPPFGAKAGSARAGRKDLSFSSSNKQMEFLQHIYNSLKPGGRAAVILPDNALFEDGVGKSVRQELMAKCNLHTILRLPTGIFYAPGVKTNVLFFAKCGEGIAATSAVWFYDLRTNMPRFGKRHPLSLAHFSGFINAFGSDPLGQSEGRAKIADPRFRVFSREKIAREGDNLDILWLRDDKLDDPENGAEPEEIVAEIARLLTSAKLQVDALQASLADDIGLG